MTRRTELLALAERVEAGEAGALLLGDICVASGIGPVMSMPCWQFPDGAPCWPDVIGSIDAQAALPGRVVKVWTAPDGMGAEAVSGSVISECVYARTEPAARLAALLRAMAEDAA